METQLDIWSYLNDGSVKIPNFDKLNLEEQGGDGYWIGAVDINGNGKLDLITSGLAIGEVAWYENPTWEKRVIATFPAPVAIDYGDIAGNGRNDLVISHNFGNCAFWCRPEDGKISWLENPGNYDSDEPWDSHFISDLMATHRVKLGYFTQTAWLELLGIPVVGCKPYGEGVHDPIQMTLYKCPDNPRESGEWQGNAIDTENFSLVHDVIRDKFGGYSGEGHDSLMVASAEGVSWFYYNPSNYKWETVLLGAGEQRYKDLGYTGCSSIAYGRIGDDPYAYIATIDPFHGNIVALYTRQPGQALTDHIWRRTVIDTFGEFTPSEHAAGHHIIAGDFDGDGQDEFLVALRGPLPNQGVYYYKIIDLERGLVERWRVSTASASLIATGDFNGDGLLDFATTSYYTPGFFLCDNAQVNVHYNRFADK